MWSSLRLISQVSHPYKSGTITDLRILILILGDRKRKHIEMKSSKYSQGSVVSQFLRCYNFDWVASFPNISVVPYFERFISCVYSDFVVHSGHQMCPIVINEMSND